MKSFFRKTNFKVEPAPVSHVDDLSFATRDDQEMANLGKIQQLRVSVETLDGLGAQDLRESSGLLVFGASSLSFVPSRSPGKQC